MPRPKNANKEIPPIDSDKVEEGAADKNQTEHKAYEWGKWSFLARLFFIDVDPLIGYGYK